MGGIFNNEGTVGSYTDAECKTPDPNTGNKSSIVGNTGTVVVNVGGITYNGAGARDTGDDIEIDKDNLEPDATVVVNKGEIVTNIGKVTTNAEGGEISENGGYVGTNDKGAVVEYNNGMIGENRGTVNSNEVQIEYDDAKDDFVPKFGTNGEPIPAVITKNSGTVEMNYGTVETNAIDGVVNNYNAGGVVAASNDDAIETPTEQPPAVAGIGTNFGTVHNKVDGNTYYGLSWGESVDKLNSIESFVVAGTQGINLDEIANGVKRSGYKMTDYTAFARKEGKDVEIDNIADYAMNAPTWLQILWEKIAGKSEPKPTRTPVYTNLSGDQVKVGAFLRVGDCIFKIIEVNEDNIRVATVKQLPEKALTDMLGFLKQYLSDAQIAKFQGEPELLEEELIAKFFGGSNEHIAFYASRDLFA